MNDNHSPPPPTARWIPIVGFVGPGDVVTITDRAALERARAVARRRGALHLVRNPDAAGA